MNQRLQHIFRNKWTLSLGAGLLLGLSFPPFPFPFLQLPAFILLFKLVQECRSARQLASYAYPGFLLWNTIVSYWLVMASIPAGIAAIVANAFLMSLVLMLFYQVNQYSPRPVVTALLQATMWVSFEYLHHQWDLSWPWLSLGNGWANATPLIQYISVTGFLGISFWVLFSAALCWQAWWHAQKGLKVAAVLLLVIPPAISITQFTTQNYRSPAASTTTVEAVVAQPNFDSYQPLGGYPTAMQALQVLTNISDSLRTPQTDLVLWPENGLHPTLSNARTGNPAAAQVKKAITRQASDWNTTIIGGAGYFDFFDSTSVPPLPLYAGNRPYLPYNAALGFSPDQSIRVYRKHNLVTVVERFPFVQFFNAIDVFGWVNWPQVQQYGQGNSPTQFAVGPTKTPALICYDSVYPGWVNKFVRNGAGFLSIITNDGWWGNTSGHHQHFAYARLRAIEFRRWVLRSANNGISGVIDPSGAIIKKTPYWQKTGFRAQIPVRQNLTFYARHGDWLPTLLLIISIGGLLLLAIAWYQGQQPRHQSNA